MIYMYFLDFFLGKKVLLLLSGVGVLFILIIAYRTNRPNHTKQETRKKGREEKEIYPELKI